MRRGRATYCRHSVATGGALAPVIDCVIEDLETHGCGSRTYDVDFHEETIRCKYLRVVSRAGNGAAGWVGSGGFGVRGQECVLEDCVAHQPGVPGFKVFGAVTAGSIQGSKFIRCRSIGSTSYGFHMAGEEHCPVQGTVLVDCGATDDAKENIYATWTQDITFDGFVFGNVTSAPGNDGANARLYASKAGAIKDVRFLNCNWQGTVAKGIRLFMDGDTSNTAARPTHVSILGGRVTDGAVLAQGPRASHIKLHGLTGTLTASLWKGSASNVSVRNNEITMNAAGIAVVEMVSGTVQTRLNVTGNAFTGTYQEAVKVDASVTAGLIHGNDFEGHAVSATGLTIGTNI